MLYFYSFIIILMVIASVLMCFIVLIQNSKGGGLASAFASSNQIMGVRKTTDFLEKLTWGLAIFMVVCSVASAYFLPKVTVSDSSVMTEQATQEAPISPTTIPGFEAPAAETAPATSTPDSAGN